MCLITFWENPITLLPVRFLAALIHCSSCSLNPELISFHVQQARSREPTIDLRRPLNISIHLFQLFHASWNVSTDFYHQDNWSRIHGEQRKAFWSRFSQVNKDSSRRKRNAHGTHETDRNDHLYLPTRLEALNVHNLLDLSVRKLLWR